MNTPVIRHTTGGPSHVTRFHDYPAFVSSPEVWAVIRARHNIDLAVFSSFSDSTGTFNGGPGTDGRMETTYGLDGADIPLIGARTTWTIDPAKPFERVDEKHEYFLFIAIKEPS